MLKIDIITRAMVIFERKQKKTLKEIAELYGISSGSVFSLEKGMKNSVTVPPPRRNKKKPKKIEYKYIANITRTISK